MTKSYLSYHNIISPLGVDTHQNFEQLKNEKTAIRLVDDPSRFYKPFYGGLIDDETLHAAFSNWNVPHKFTRLERLLILSLSKTIKNSNIPLTHRVGLIIATTKGNIDVLEHDSSFPKNRAYLWALGTQIKNYFGFKNDAILLSNACVSGVLAISVAKRYLQKKIYDHVFIVAGDLISNFVLSGFNSFQALSPDLCRPYDKNRAGINLGEAAASILVTSNPKDLPVDAVEIIGDASANDANHISGPSRTGEGLYRSIKSAITEANIAADKIDYISAHGTATLYNDEMEALAFNRLSLEHVPLHSLKGYYGHTLGAAGLLETIIGMQSLAENRLIRSAGFEELGISKPLNIIKKTTTKNLNTFLKTASGFGGCNSAAIFRNVS